MPVLDDAKFGGLSAALLAGATSPHPAGMRVPRLGWLSLSESGDNTLDDKRTRTKQTQHN